MNKDKSNTLQKIITVVGSILLVICLIPVIFFVGSSIFFYIAFSQERSPNPNYNPTSYINEQYDIEIPLDSEITYRAYTNWAGFSGDGTTYCVYNISNTYIKNVNWCETKNENFEIKVDKILDSLNESEELLNYDENFKLEHRFDWSSSYKWFSKVKPFSSNEFVENEIVNHNACELFLFYLESTSELFLLEQDF